MEVLKGGKLKEQRRILIEVPELVTLFDMFVTFLRYEFGSQDVDTGFEVDFSEMSGDLAELLNMVIDEYLEQIDLVEAINFAVSPKTGIITPVSSRLQGVLDKLCAKDEDGLMRLMVRTMRITLIETLEKVLTDIFNESGLLNFKKVNIKTRRHVVVVC